MEYNINITNLKKELYKVNDSIVNLGWTVNVSSKKGNVIMMSKKDYDSLIETLYLSSNPEIKKPIVDGMKDSHEDCIDEKEIDL